MNTVLEEKEQFIVNASGKRVGVVLDLHTYERLRVAEEELDDIRAYDAAAPGVKAEIAKGDFITLADYRKARSAKRKGTIRSFSPAPLESKCNVFQAKPKSAFLLNCPNWKQIRVRPAAKNSRTAMPGASAWATTG